jgi:hypothetical protein
MAPFMLPAEALVLEQAAGDASLPVEICRNQINS